ncbi:L-galactose dehydrogenase [Tetranychus urticae]|uniref:NADP-dependent oxidoreductase domain-containing protein n=1 Tax=Tetranychus urticae TaxID=32264 RepID=T1KM79_TETUR|nr:L-galactose dehydrogenase [Tetranychus urticae]
MDLPLTFNSDIHDLNKISSLKKHYNFLGNTKLEVFKVGLGTGISFGLVDFDDNGEPFGNEYEIRATTVIKALQEGINYFDTAPLYAAGKAERVLGKAIQGLPRESFYLATKVGRNHQCQFDYSPRGVRETFETSLRNLRVESVDLVTIHDIEFADNLESIVKDVIPILEQYRREGKLRYIGCSGYPLEPLVNLTQLAKGRLDTCLSYGRMTLFNTDLMKCSPLINNSSIGLINASLLGMGLLTPNVLLNPPVPYWHPASPDLVAECQKAAQLCLKEGVNLAKIATHFSLTKCPQTALHLIGMITPDQLENNLSVLKGGLTDQESRIEAEISQMFNCVKTHWEGVEVSKYRQDPKKFTDNLLYGPQA